MQQARLPALDIVRGLAILCVLMFHFRTPTGSAGLDAVVQPILAVGWWGVDLFFVLSGFLVGRLILSESEATGAVDLRRFFLRRGLRLWPVLWLYCGTLLLLGGKNAWAMVWPVLLHVQNYGVDAPSHLWSLAVEEHFYLGAALFVPALLRRGGHRAVQRALLAIMLLCLTLRLAAIAVGVPMLHLQWQTQYRLDAPAFGVLMASVSLDRQIWFASLVRARGRWLALSAACVAMLAMGGEGAFRHGVGFTIAYLAGGACILGMMDMRVATAPRAPAAALAALGAIAYPLYIWHASVGAVVRATIAIPALAFAGSLIAAIGLAAVLHVTIEQPALRRRDRTRTAPHVTNATASHSL